MSKDNCNSGCKKSSIGGQALLEGVMMRGPEKEAMAVRLPDGTIDLEVWDLPKAKWYKKVPFVRGPVNFISSMLDGYKCLTKSADKAMQGIEEEEPSNFEKLLTEKLGDKLMTIVMVIASVLGVALALMLFMFVPSLVTKGIGLLLPLGDFAKTCIEGLIKIGVFIAYIALTSLMKDIKRTYEYHG
ncbi:MAG: DUF1385 domain-containing protein, partial [Oscillospiraceae bacterium]|nr:DUF1385 domain-containing protein [Oscillospiraceae bacterium]